MATEKKTPGVYIEEVPNLPPSIASVETAIPAFIGYTEKAQWKSAGDLYKKPWRIESMLEYEQYFGFPAPENDSITVAFGNEVSGTINEDARSKYLMHYSLEMFYANGGGPCWIVSVGDYSTGLISDGALLSGLKEVEKINEVTLLVFPEAINLETEESFYIVYSAAIAQAVKLQDRFVIMDVYHNKDNGDNWRFDIGEDGQDGGLRNRLSGTTDDLKYAAAYFPRIYTGVDYSYKMPNDQENDNDASIKITGVADVENLADLKNKDNAKYFQAKNAISNIQMLLPPSPAMAGIYAKVDNSRGVWKAPANVNIENAIAPEILITNEQQQDLNVDSKAGRSINVIRKFEGRGPAIVWGARTLAGNDNEWRYISVRRYFNMVEESTKNATEQYVFEPNDINTWVRVKSMVSNYLTEQWKSGALMGANTKEAFFVKVGLGETMTELDIWEGRMIVVIGMAVVRPAEFIILRFMHKMLQES